MMLAALQRAFMSHVLAEDRPLPSAWDGRMRAGLDVYRHAYRTRLVDALRETFELTAKWAGEEPFRAAAAHYLISEPPTGWTLDRLGDGFVARLEMLFTGDPDVADLAWLEWAMHCAFTAPDRQPLDPVGFARATTGFAEDDWPAMTLGFVPSLQLREVATDCASLWRLLKQAGSASSQPLPEPAACLVWREGFSPVFRLTGHVEGGCLEKMLEGARFEEICSDLAEAVGDETAATDAGAMLRRWIEFGLIASVRGRTRRVRSGGDAGRFGLEVGTEAREMPQRRR